MGLTVRGWNPGGGVRYSAPVQSGPGAHPASYTMGAASFPGVKRPRHGVDHPPPSSAEVKERIEYTCASPQGLCSLFSVTFTFTFSISVLTVTDVYYQGIVDMPVLQC
jgi:hypothetical protein